MEDSSGDYMKQSNEKRHISLSLYLAALLITAVIFLVGIYVGKKLDKNSKRSGVPLWRWGIVKRMTSRPTVKQIKAEIKKNNGLKGYAMRIKPRPWKKTSSTISI